MIATMGKVQGITHDLLQANGHQPTVDETARVAEMTTAETNQAIRVIVRLRRSTSRLANTVNIASASSLRISGRRQFAQNEPDLYRPGWPKRWRCSTTVSGRYSASVSA